MFVSRLTIYPLAGSRGIDVERIDLLPNGELISDDTIDRGFVCYDPTTKKRVSIKRLSQMSLLSARVVHGNGLVVRKYHPKFPLMRTHEAEIAKPLSVRQVSGDLPDSSSLVGVDEFGDINTMYDLGDDAAQKMSELLDHDVRIAQKLWKPVTGLQGTEPKVAPLHLVARQSLESAIRMSTGNYATSGYIGDGRIELLYRQLRAGMLIDTGATAYDSPQFPEMVWERGVTLRSKGSVAGIEMVRRCIRCAATAVNPNTGEKDSEVRIFEEPLRSQLIDAVPRGIDNLPHELVFGQYAKASGSNAVVRVEVGQALHPFGMPRDLGSQ